MLTPVLALIVWSLIVWIWMYATRIPAMRAAGVDPQKARFPGSLDVLPDRVRQVADNYNHLMEQPTIFYALVFYIVFAGHSDPFSIDLAWAYVALRVLHTLIQCTVNNVTWRFSVFTLSTLILMAMAGGRFLRCLRGLRPAGILMVSQTVSPLEISLLSALDALFSPFYIARPFRRRPSGQPARNAVGKPVYLR